MKGRDGVADRQFVDFSLATDGTVIIAAPGVGLEIAVFAVVLSENPAALCGFEDGTGAALWRSTQATQRPLAYACDVALFTCGDNQPCSTHNAPLATMVGNLSFEIRPTGL